MRGHKFLVGNELSLADLHVVSDLIPFHDFIISKLPALSPLNEWYERVYNSQPFQDGLKLFVSESEKIVRKSQRSDKLRILCLHGYRQSGSGFREKLGAFRKTVGKNLDLVFVDAPHQIPLSEEVIAEKFYKILLLIQFYFTAF